MSPANRILILHGAAGMPPLPPDELDVLEEVAAAAGALRDLGYEPVALAVTLDLRPVSAALRELRPIGVFNLVEAVNTRLSLGHPEASLGASWPSDRYADRARGIAGRNVASTGKWTRLRFKSEVVFALFGSLR